MTIIEEYIEWANKTFPESTIHTILAHLTEELKELKEAPEDELELADCCTLILHAAHKIQNSEYLQSVVKKKFEINKSRTWARSPEGYFKHV